jgi:cyclase
MNSKHFDIIELAEGVYAAIATQNGAGVSNAGVIDLGGHTLVVDTLLTPQAARDLRRFAEEQTGRAPDLVVNTHFHNDHVWGNQVFLPEAQIIASEETLRLMKTWGVEELEDYTVHSAGRLNALREEYAAETDEAKKADKILWIAYYEGIIEALPTLKVCLPDITFERRLTLHGDRYSAQLLAFERGHTLGDTVVYLPETRIAFLSDLLFVGCHPYLADGDPLALRAVLVELQSLDARVLVPGHGPPGDREDLQRLVDYIDLCIETARSLPEEPEWDTLAPPPAYQDWQFPQFYRANIRCLENSGD